VSSYKNPSLKVFVEIVLFVNLALLKTFGLYPTSVSPSALKIKALVFFIKHTLGSMDIEL
jgi:hypothetical protein